MDAIRLSEFGSTGDLEMSVFQALLAGNGTAPLSGAPMPRLAFAIEPYCQAGGFAWAKDETSVAVTIEAASAIFFKSCLLCDIPPPRWAMIAHFRPNNIRQLRANGFGARALFHRIRRETFTKPWGHPSRPEIGRAH